MSVAGIAVRVIAAVAVAFWCFTIMSVAVFALPGEERGPLYSVLAIVAGIIVPAAIGLYLVRGTLSHPPRLPERDLLAMLQSGRSLTAIDVALRTSFTVNEAAAMLEQLSAAGHVESIEGETARRYRLADAMTNHAGVLAPELPAPAEPLVEPLSDREIEVLNRLATGRSNREIALDLYITVGTVKTHTNNIYRKLDARNRTEALARARALCLLQD
jgi:LuxR family maltose regulon positive regulatory protein